MSNCFLRGVWVAGFFFCLFVLFSFVLDCFLLLEFVGFYCFEGFFYNFLFFRKIGEP